MCRCFSVHTTTPAPRSHSAIVLLQAAPFPRGEGRHRVTTSFTRHPAACRPGHMFVTTWQDFGWKLVNVNENSIFFLMYKPWFFGAGFYARAVFICSVGFFFSTFFNNRFFQKGNGNFSNQLVNDFYTRIF